MPNPQFLDIINGLLSADETIGSANGCFIPASGRSSFQRLIDQRGQRRCIAASMKAAADRFAANILRFPVQLFRITRASGGGAEGAARGR